ncbi:MAG: enoyl-CoA hydratase/isomerase family protein [Proteobacteria bacterium]|nr:enoyl-CoA hydratase/isomerase family protein [Pseudomonadota bacterium]MDA0845284.1 enoyl-CoA hydratase/isomerase family protein [Pseudomonadota bacterium]
MTKHNTEQNAVIIAHHNGVTTCTLNRPDKLNALNADMVEGLVQTMREATAKDSQLVVFQGAGRAFCAGFDLSDLTDMSDADLLLRFVRIETLLQAIYTAPMPTLALVHGRCFGAGADIVASCSQRIASPDSSFRMPGLQFGIVLGTRRLTALIGVEAVRNILQTSRVFDAETAHSCGFLTAIAARDDWDQNIAKATTDAAVLTNPSRHALMQQTRDDRYLDADMAALVRSASQPGLGARIAAYVASLKKTSTS